MLNENRTISRALISVSDKTGLVELATALHERNIEIIATGGTSRLLRSAKIPVLEVAEITKFPEMMAGRVKTLHPQIQGGILGKRDQHAMEAKQQGIEWIDLVIVNLYPFAETIKKDVSFADAIEQIDIGGPTLIRAAAKNMEWVTVLVDPKDYAQFLQEWQAVGGIRFNTRKQLAAKAFALTTYYDYLIQQYLYADQPNPETLTLSFQKWADLRYGENPHQPASAYRCKDNSSGILGAQKSQGKPLSYNNILDADAAFACVQEFKEPACVIVKHANPCGVAIHSDLYEAFQAAYAADSVSAFGGIFAFNRECTEKLAAAILTHFVEVIIAPSYSQAARALFATKPNIRLLELNFNQTPATREYRFIEGGLLLQDKNMQQLKLNELKTVTANAPLAEDMISLLFAWSVLKHVKSNAILLAKNGVTVGIGAGQMSRVDAVDLALKKAASAVNGAILASDAFFPFRDSIDRIAGTGIRAIIQPGGSVRDDEVIAACNEQGIAMVFTGMRCFKH